MRKAETKVCEVCKTTFTKTVNCSKKDWKNKRFCSRKCKAESQLGKQAWNKGLMQDPSESKMKFLPCRICGKPTKYHGTEKSHLFGQVRCDNPDCIAKSKELKNDKIRQAMNSFVEVNGKIGTGTWKDVKSISKIEESITPWFESIGWKSQLNVNTDIKINAYFNKVYRLDFANEKLKLYIEIDGRSHAKPERKEKDRDRDRILSDLGWTGLRIPDKDVKRNLEATKEKILEWILSNS